MRSNGKPAKRGKTYETNLALGASINRKVWRTHQRIVAEKKWRGPGGSCAEKGLEGGLKEGKKASGKNKKTSVATL